MTDVVTAEGVDQNRVLQLAASAEQGSEHPLGEAIIRAAQERKLPLLETVDFQAVTGLGIQVTVENQAVVLGNRALMQKYGVDTAAYDDKAEMCIRDRYRIRSSPYCPPVRSRSR